MSCCVQEGATDGVGERPSPCCRHLVLRARGRQRWCRRAPHPVLGHPTLSMPSPSPRVRAARAPCGCAFCDAPLRRAAEGLQGPHSFLGQRSLAPRRVHAWCHEHTHGAQYQHADTPPRPHPRRASTKKEARKTGCHWRSEHLRALLSPPLGIVTSLAWHNPWVRGPSAKGAVGSCASHGFRRFPWSKDIYEPKPPYGTQPLGRNKLNTN